MEITVTIRVDDKELHPVVVHVPTLADAVPEPVLPRGTVKARPSWLPTRATMKHDLYKLLRKNGPMKARDAVKALADKYALTDEQLVLRNGRTNTLFNNEVNWCRFLLCDEGRLDGSRFGWWTPL